MRVRIMLAMFLAIVTQPCLAGISNRTWYGHDKLDAMFLGSDEERAAVEQLTTDELFDLVATGEVREALGALGQLTRDWDAVTENFERLMTLARQNLGSLKVDPKITPEVAAADDARGLPECRTRGDLILYRLAETVREAPLGLQRTALTSRLMAHLKSIVKGEPSPVPRHMALRTFVRCVFYPNRLIRPAADTEHVKKLLVDSLEDPDFRVRVCAVYGLGKIAGVHREVLPLIEERYEVELNADDAGEPGREGALEGMRWLLIGLAPYEKWPGRGPVAEDLVRAMPDMTPSQLIDMFRQGSTASWFAMDAIMRDEGSRVACIPALLEIAASDERLFQTILGGVPDAIPERASAAEKAWMEQFLVFLERCLTEEPVGRGRSMAIKKLRFMAQSPTGARYVRERAFEDLLGLLGHGEPEVREEAFDCVRNVLRESPDLLEIARGPLEQRQAELLKEHGLNLADKPRGRYYPPEWETYMTIENVLYHQGRRPYVPPTPEDHAIAKARKKAEREARRLSESRQ